MKRFEEHAKVSGSEVSYDTVTKNRRTLMKNPSGHYRQERNIYV